MHVVDLMRPWAPVQSRPMFGGFGLYREGRMFALIANETLYFKADPINMAVFFQHGLQPFTYQSGDKTATLKYFAAPAEVYDDAGQMAEWADLAWGSAVRQANKPTKGRKPRKQPPIYGP